MSRNKLVQTVQNVNLFKYTQVSIYADALAEKIFNEEIIPLANSGEREATIELNQKELEQYGELNGQVINEVVKIYREYGYEADIMTVRDCATNHNWTYITVKWCE